MVKKAVNFTPEVLIGSPRRSVGKPSPCGRYILHTIRSYDFSTHSRTSELRIVEYDKGFSHLIVGDGKATEAHWLPNSDILYLRSNEHGGVEWVLTDVKAEEHQVVACSPYPIRDLKLESVSDEHILVLGWARADRSGRCVNEDKEPTPAHASRLYDSQMPRLWDRWTTKYHNSLLFMQLKKLRHPTGKKVWDLSAPESVHEGTAIECPAPPFPGSEHYAVSKYGVAFVARDPDINPALYNTWNCYFVPLSSEGGSYSVDTSRGRKISTEGHAGGASSPIFSPDGKSLAFLKMKSDLIEPDHNSIFFIHNLDADSLSAVSLQIASEQYDINPLSISYGHDERVFFLTAEFNGMTRLWSLDLTNGELQPLTRSGSVLDIKPMYNPPRMFFSGSSNMDDSFYGVLWPHSPHNPEIISSHSKNGQMYGLDASQFTSFWYAGEESTVHALMVLPPGFDFNDKSKTYPLAMLVHGGPQGAWLDSWNLKWNPAVWAAQGFVVVLPNITGSTGYGKKFMDGVTNNWGGTPYEDLVKCMEHIKEHMSFIDLDRAVAAGGSYGGFMMNWINGHDLGKQFKALVCHDGTFCNVSAQLATDGLWFSWHENGGPPWEQHEGATGWRLQDPSLHIHNWTTPQLTIHNEKDFRLDIAEGLAPFNVLQAKGIPSRLLVAQDENHWTLGEENSLVWHTVVLNWVNKFVGLPPCKEDEASIIEPSDSFPKRW